MSARGAFKFTSTTTLQPVTGCIAGVYTDHISVMNKTDGDVEVYIGSQDVPAIILPSEAYLAFDQFEYQGQIYVKNSTGTGGDVYIHIWKGAEQ